ncbi:MAG: ABC transporter substrate-binding protein [Chloroflexi bacterium]|nr:ABC transporter substrate-binding protein [Chloroflexota bacterium]
MPTVLSACGPAAAPTAPTTPPAPAPTTAPVAAKPTIVPTQAAPAAAAPTQAAAPTAAQAAAGAAPSGTLRYASADFSGEVMDPRNVGGQWGWTLYDTLLTFDKEGNVVGDIAETYNLSADGLTWTFNVRKGVKFHNGDLLTSADVAFSLQHFGAKEATNPWSPYILKNNESITATDDYTVVFKAQKPEWPLKVPFTQTPIFPKNYYESVGADGFQAKPMGSGPYKFANWVPKTSMEYDANTDYWGPAKPQWAHVTETLVPEESTRVAQLQRGDVDIIGNLSFDRLVELKNGGFRLEEVGLPTLANLSFPGTWLTHGPTGDVRVRQAMSYAINRQELCDTFYKGLAKPGGFWFFSDQTWGWDDTFKADPYDPAKAKQLLSDAGYPGKFNPQTTTLYTNAVAADLMQAVQGYWQAIGINVDIQVVDTPVYNGVWSKRPTAATDQNAGVVWPWVNVGAFNNVYHSANQFTSQGVNGTGNDPKADEMYQAAVAELDDAKAKQLWRQLMHYAYDTMWTNVELVEVPTYFAVGPNVGAFTNRTWLNIWDTYAGIQRKA